MLDNRIVRIGIEIEGQIREYEGLWIHATGTKFDNALMNETEVRIANLSREDREYILTEARPYNFRRVPKRIYVDAGRVSIGVARVFDGVIIEARPTQPPDVQIVMRCFTGHFYRTEIVSKSLGANAQLSTIAQQYADDLGLGLDFQAQDKNVANYSFTGPANRETAKINDIGGINAYVDDQTLVIKDTNKALQNRFIVISEETGMIGTPVLTQLGVDVKFLLDTTTKVGSGIEVRSIRYPVVNGQYVIYKLHYDIASREQPFYLTASAFKLGER